MRATLATLRIFAAVLRDDPVNCVVSTLSRVARIDGDAAARVPTAVLCEADDNVEIRDKPLAGWPIVLILEDEAGEDFDAEANVGFRDGTVGVTIAIIDEPAKQAEGYRTAKYIQQAIVDGIEHGLLASDKLDSAGVLDGIAVMQATQLSTGKLNQEFGVGTVTAGVRYKVQVRDHTP